MNNIPIFHPKNEQGDVENSTSFCFCSTAIRKFICGEEEYKNKISCAATPCEKVRKCPRGKRKGKTSVAKSILFFYPSNRNCPFVIKNMERSMDLSILIVTPMYLRLEICSNAQIICPQLPPTPRLMKGYACCR